MKYILEVGENMYCVNKNVLTFGNIFSGQDFYRCKDINLERVYLCPFPMGDNSEREKIH